MAESGAVNWDLFVDGKEQPDEAIVQFTVEKDLNQPDMAVLVLRNDDHAMSKACGHGAVLELKLNQDGKTLFKGEIVGVEPQYKAQGESRVVVRAFGDLHKALRGRKSRTFQDKTDKQILTEALGMSPEWKGPEITHKHVYQHNQSDLEFARQRAARLGCFIWMADGKLMVKRPELDKDSGIVFRIQASDESEHAMAAFAPRMSAVGLAKAVEVRSASSETKDAIVGKATATASPLGDSNAAAAAKGVVAEETFLVDQPLWSTEEANALAEARLQELSLAYITGEGEAKGNIAYQPAIVVTIVVNETDTDRFNGKYFVTGVTHSYRQGKGAGAGYRTTLRVCRDAEGGKP